MFARTFLLVACAGLAGCEAPDRVRGRDAVSQHSIRGRVLGPSGVYLEGAALTLHALAEDGEKYVAATRTAFDGSFTVQTSRVGPHRLVATHESAADSVAEIEVGTGVGTIDQDFVLAPGAAATIRGFLASAAGAPFDTPDLARLFPSAVGHDVARASQGSDGVTEYFPFVGGSRLVARQAHGGRTPGGDAEAVVDAATGKFEIAVDREFDGRLALDFRGAEIASVPLSGSAKTVEMFVDAEAAFLRLGSLEIASADPTSSFDRLVVLRADARVGAASARDDVEEYFELDAPKPPLRLVGIPRGDYLVVGLAGEESLAIAPARVEGATSTRVTLEFVATASATIEIAGERTDPAPISDTAQLRSLDGLSLPARFRDGAGNALMLDGAAPGRCALFADSGFAVLDLAAGAATSARVELRPLQPTELRVRLFDSWRWQLVAAVPAQLRVFSGDVLVSDARFDVEFDAEGWVTTALDLPPGRYRVEFEIDGYRRVDGEIEAGLTSVFPFGDFDAWVEDPERRRHGRLDR